MRYERIDTDQPGIIAYGVTPQELFEHAGWGMFDMMFDLRGVDPVRDVPVMAAGDTCEDLLIGWLTELLGLAHHHDLAFCYFTVDRLEEGGVQGSAGGVPAASLEMTGWNVQAIDRSGLAVVENPATWWARLLFKTG